MSEEETYGERLKKADRDIEELQNLIRILELRPHDAEGNEELSILTRMYGAGETMRADFLKTSRISLASLRKTREIFLAQHGPPKEIRCPHCKYTGEFREERIGEGGFRGTAQQLSIWLEREKSKSINLAGNWKYMIEITLNPYEITGPGGGKPKPPMGPDHPHRPAGLYNAMIHPLAPFSIRGAIWYQGEANTMRAYQYRTLLADMISDWRMLWRRDYFHFGIVQLANFGARSVNPSESEWAELREAQAMVARQLPRTWLATTIDIGEANDIHPRNKQDVGKRLALWPMKHIYNQSVVESGPTFKSFMIWGKNYVALELDNVSGGVVSKNREPIKGLTIAGADRVFFPAVAEWRGGRLVVWSEKVERPAAVRYGWANNPECNLYNDKGLPAVPFRTDNWPGITINRR